MRASKCRCLNSIRVSQLLWIQSQLLPHSKSCWSLDRRSYNCYQESSQLIILFKILHRASCANPCLTISSRMSCLNFNKIRRQKPHHWAEKRAAIVFIVWQYRIDTKVSLRKDWRLRDLLTKKEVNLTIQTQIRDLRMILKTRVTDRPQQRSCKSQNAHILIENITPR